VRRKREGYKSKVCASSNRSDHAGDGRDELAGMDVGLDFPH
jgi:hypothetical protein